MDRHDQEAIRRHHAGATVVHHGPFSDLATPQNDEELPVEMIEKFVVPIYMNIGTMSMRVEEVKDLVRSIASEVSHETVEKLLGDFNWRTRSVGAFFAGLKEMREFQDTIGRLLLKSEVCYAGRAYCMSLVAFGDERSAHYLNKYLGYYLTQPHLHFDQCAAVGALAYLDAMNGSTHLREHMDQWSSYCGVRPQEELGHCIAHFRGMMDNFNAVRSHAA